VGHALAGKSSWDRHKVGFLVAFDAWLVSFFLSVGAIEKHDITGWSMIDYLPLCS
jgi:hypothetical protein